MGISREVSWHFSTRSSGSNNVSFLSSNKGSLKFEPARKGQNNEAACYSWHVLATNYHAFVGIQIIIDFQNYFSEYPTYL
jgi:hypothetical protein